jgi:hypothetical protein
VTIQHYGADRDRTDKPVRLSDPSMPNGPWA